MSVVETDKIDSISLEVEHKRVFLSIIDPLAWDLDDLHLFTLQEKINTYLFFIESKGLFREKPETEDFDIIIELVLKYIPSEQAVTFFDKTTQILFDKGIIFLFGPNKETGYIDQI